MRVLRVFIKNSCTFIAHLQSNPINFKINKVAFLSRNLSSDVRVKHSKKVRERLLSEIRQRMAADSSVESIIAPLQQAVKEQASYKK